MILSTSSFTATLKKPKGIQNYQSLRVMLVGHLSHYNTTYNKLCLCASVVMSITAQWWQINTLRRYLGLCCKLTNNLPQTRQTRIFPPLNQGCYSTLRSSNIKMQWHNNQDTILLWPVIMRINPPYHHFPYSVWLRGAATKLEHNLPKSWGVKKTRSITQRIHARSGYFQKKQRWTSPGNSHTAEGLLMLVRSCLWLSRLVPGT